MILSLLNNIKYCPSIKLMNCDIVDENAENTKLKKIEIKDIEDMVQKKCEDLNNQDAEQLTDEDSILSDKINYDINYLKKDLVHIMNYYGLSIRKKKKSDLIDDIVEFENEPDNQFIVDHRKTLWFYWDELSNDEYLSKFVIST
tara:strand:+ start:46 stop:477 length:432 start_codon:yes stop_codon:yes gene_type:complete